MKGNYDIIASMLDRCNSQEAKDLYIASHYNEIMGELKKESKMINELVKLKKLANKLGGEE